MTLYYDKTNPKFDLNGLFYNGKELVGTDTRILVSNPVGADFEGMLKDTLLIPAKVSEKNRLYKGKPYMVVKIEGEYFDCYHHEKGYPDVNRIIYANGFKPLAEFKKDFPTMLEVLYAVGNAKGFMIDWKRYVATVKKLPAVKEVYLMEKSIDGPLKLLCEDDSTIVMLGLDCQGLLNG